MHDANKTIFRTNIHDIHYKRRGATLIVVVVVPWQRRQTNILFLQLIFGSIYELRTITRRESTDYSLIPFSCCYHLFFNTLLLLLCDDDDNDISSIKHTDIRSPVLWGGNRPIIHLFFTLVVIVVVYDDDDRTFLKSILCYCFVTSWVKSFWTSIKTPIITVWIKRQEQQFLLPFLLK